MVLVTNLEKAIWNWVEQYPEEFVQHHRLRLDLDLLTKKKLAKVFDNIYWLDNIIWQRLFDNIVLTKFWGRLLT